MSIQLKNGFQNESLDRVLEDLLVRFVINAPPEDLASNARVFFLFEEAHWFYLDYVRNINPALPTLKMKAFSKKLIELFPLIWKGGDPEEGLKEFSNYKQSIPVRGAALFDSSMKNILLVQGVESPNWSFPRGKISKDEDDADCAIREVKEEIGFDISPYVNKDDYIERTIRAKNYRIYLCKDIPSDFEFKPLVRNEINDIKWTNFRRLTTKVNSNPQKYFLVTSMIHPLKQWVKKHRDGVDEVQLKLEVEAQLKFLLGVGQEEKPRIDPGRDLLDFIRQSTAKKQIKDQQQNQTVIPPQQQFQLTNPSQQPQPGFHPQMFAPLPIPQPLSVIPGMGGFQRGPPFQNLPFFTPFVPPPLNGLPLQFTYPIFNPNLPQIQPNANGPINPDRPPVEYQNIAPNPDQLARPSFSSHHKNEEQSKELLSILNKKTNDKKSNAQELLSLFNDKRQNGKNQEKLKEITQNSRPGSNDYSKGLLALLQKQPKAEQASNPNTNDQKEVKTEDKKSSDNDNKIIDNDNKSSANALLSLLKKPQKSSTPSPRSVTPRSATPSAESQTQKTTPKPKLRILKREESLPAPASPNVKSPVPAVETNVEPKKPKFQILKRDQPFPEQPQQQTKPITPKKDTTQVAYDHDTNSRSFESKPQNRQVDDRQTEEQRAPRFSNSTEDGDHPFTEAAPPSRELLDLIKQSKNHDGELFEDFTDEEFELSEEDDQGDGEGEGDDENIEEYEGTEDEDDDDFQSFGSEGNEEDYEEDYKQGADDNASSTSIKDNFEKQDDFKAEDFEIEEEYKYDMDELKKSLPEIDDSVAENSIEEFVSLKNNSINEGLQESQPQVQPPKKFVLLKRGEDIETALKNHSEETKSESQVESESPAHNDNDNENDDDKEIDINDDEAQLDLEQQSGTSTIQFSDDGEDEEEDEEEEETNNFSESEEELQTNDQTEDQEQEHDQSQDQDQEKIQEQVEVQSQEQDQDTEIDGDVTPRVETPVENAKAKNDLLNILHQNVTPTATTPIKTLDDIESETTNSTIPAFKSSNNSNDLLNTLFKSAKQDDIPSTTATPKEDPSKSLLNLLHKKEPISSNEIKDDVKPSQPSPSETLLGLLGKKPETSASTPVPVVQDQISTPKPVTNASADLLSLLHGKPQSENNQFQSPTQHQPEQYGQVQQQQQQQQVEQPQFQHEQIPQQQFQQHQQPVQQQQFQQQEFNNGFQQHPGQFNPQQYPQFNQQYQQFQSPPPQPQQLNPLQYQSPPPPNQQYQSPIPPHQQFQQFQQPQSPQYHTPPQYQTPPPQTQFQHAPTSNSSPANDLLSLLNKPPQSQHQQHQPSSQQPQQPQAVEPQQESNENPGKGLLKLLLRK